MKIGEYVETAFARAVGSMLFIAIAIVSVFTDEIEPKKRWRWLVLGVLIVSAGIATRCMGQQAMDTFPRDITGHRVAVSGSVVRLAPALVWQVRAILDTPRTKNLFYCFIAVPRQDTVLITHLFPVSLDQPMPRCNKPWFAGGFTILARRLAPPASHSDAYETWGTVTRLLERRIDFVGLVVTDTLEDGEPRLLWILSTPIPIDTTPPDWKKQT